MFSYFTCRTLVGNKTYPRNTPQLGKVDPEKQLKLGTSRILHTPYSQSHRLRRVTQGAPCVSSPDPAALMAQSQTKLRMAAPRNY